MSAGERPAPLVPADVDLRGLGGFMLRTDRLLSSELVALCTPEEGWAALMLWTRAWQQQPAASLPNDERVLASFSRAGRRWQKVRDMAMRGFVLCSDNRWYHRVLAEEALEAWQRRLTFRERSETANRAKRLKGCPQADLLSVLDGQPQGIHHGDLEGHEGKGSEGKGREEKRSEGTGESGGNGSGNGAGGYGQSVVITIPLCDGTEFPVPKSMRDELDRLYPAVDPDQTLREIRGWNIANPTKRKTPKGVTRHIFDWFKDEQDKQSRGGGEQRRGR